MDQNVLTQRGLNKARHDLDPLARLPYDITCQIFPYLSTRDLVRCEGVSTGWRDYLQQWMATSGYRLMLEAIWYPGLQLEAKSRLSYGDLKRHVRQVHCMQAGKPSSMSRFQNTSLFCAGQDVFAWVHRKFVYDSQRLEALVYWDDSVYWRPANTHTRRIVPVRDIFPPGSTSAVATRLSANDACMLFIQLEIRSNDRKYVRAVVYSLAENRMLWYREYSLSGQYPRSESKGNVKANIPYLLGESRVYTATWKDSHGKYLLEAYDVRTGRCLYASPVLAENWFDSHRLFERDHLAGIEHSKVIQAAHGEELIVQLLNATGHGTDGPELATSTGIGIINGRNGHLIQNIELAVDKLDHVLVHPPTKQLVMVQEVHGVSHVLARRRNKPYRDTVIMMRRFDFVPGVGLSPLYTDVVLAGGIGVTDPADRLFRQWNILAVNPFFMTAVASYYDDSYNAIPFGLWCYPIVPIDDDGLRQTAQVMVGRILELHPDAPAIRQCYVVSSRRKLMFPARPGDGPRSRIHLAIFDQITGAETRFTNEGNLIVASMQDHFLVNFTEAIPLAAACYVARVS